MNLVSQLTALRKQSENLSLTERAELSCRLSKQLEKAGEYEAACEVLADFWPDRIAAPRLEDLDQATGAEVLLRVGALAGWLGSANQAEGSQETAKNLITQSIEIFEKLGRPEKVAESRGDLALCYWREGSYDEARIHLANALNLLGIDNSELKAVLLIRAGIVEVWTRRLHEALRFYNEAAPLVEQSENDALKGSFHMEFAVLFRRLAVAENHQTYIDQALIENAAASFYHERAGNQRYLARVENNLGFLHFTIGQYQDAHSHLDRAHSLFLELKDIGTAAQVDDTRAQTLLAEGRLSEAERLVRSAVRTLERGDEQAVLAEALTTYGIVKARLGKFVRARELLDRAIKVAETAGDLEGAGRAKLSIIEELAQQTSPMEMASIFQSAADLLQQSQDPTTSKRLIACARKVIAALSVAESINQETGAHPDDSLSLRAEVRSKEKELIAQALRNAGGSVTKAAHLLGFKHHQSLSSVINSRHPDLLGIRSAVRKRRRPLISKSRKIKKQSSEPRLRPAASQISILHVEDNQLVAELIQDTLAAEGIRVDSCPDGITALELLKGDRPYNVIIVDNDLPGLSGLELVLRVRGLIHRRQILIVMLSGDDCEKEAWRAGADAFLLKPKGVDKISSTIDRLLKEREEKERGEGAPLSHKRGREV